MVVEITPTKKNPPLKKPDGVPGLEIKNPGEKSFRDHILTRDKPKPKVFRTEDGKGIGDYVVVIDGVAVVIEVKQPNGKKKVDKPEFKGNSAQITAGTFPHVVKETGATKVGGSFEVTIPTSKTITNAHWDTIFDKIKDKAGYVPPKVPPKKEPSTDTETINQSQTDSTTKESKN